VRGRAVLRRSLPPTLGRCQNSDGKGHEVIVDAGNGKVLHQDLEEEADESDGRSDTEADDDGSDDAEEASDGASDTEDAD
jgi:hypothetical protein